MRYVYDLDDIFCENKAKDAIKQEIINILKLSKTNIIDIEELFNKARNNILKNIIKNYFNNFYQSDNDFESESSIIYDEVLKNLAKSYNTINELKQKCNYILNSGFCNLTDEKNTREVSESINKNEYEVELNLNLIENLLYNSFTENSSIESIIFHKLDNGKYGVEEWIKPYLDIITFNTLSISDMNIKNYDFTSTNGIKISSTNIEDNTLSNTVLNGVTFECYNCGYLHAIDPTKVDITGTNFTGSKGAVVTLENVDQIPENCNLTDTIIVVNSKDDIKKFNLNKYKGNVYIKQDSIVYNDEIINYDFNEYFNYTGTIDNQQINSISEALRLDGANDETIRTENNKIISYLIVSELASIIDFYNLYNYFDIIKNEYPETIEEGKKVLNSDNNKNSIIGEVYKKVGSPFYENFKCINSDDKLKIFTRHGVFTIDFLKLGLSKEEKELVFKGEKDLNLGDSTNKIISNLYHTIYNYVLELENGYKVNNEELLSSNDSFYNMFFLHHEIHKTNRFKEYITNSLENLIYNNLEENNKGYSYAIKKINKSKKTR